MLDSTAAATRALEAGATHVTAWVCYCAWQAAAEGQTQTEWRDALADKAQRFRRQWDTWRGSADKLREVGCWPESWGGRLPLNADWSGAARLHAATAMADADLTVREMVLVHWCLMEAAKGRTEEEMRDMLAQMTATAATLEEHADGAKVWLTERGLWPWGCPE